MTSTAAFSPVVLCLLLGLATVAGAAPPINDNFADASEIVTAPIDGRQTKSFVGTTVDATVEPGEDNNAALGPVNDRGTVWWKWTCPGDVPTDVELHVYSWTASLAAGAFQGDSVANLTTMSPVMSDPFYHPAMDQVFEAGVVFMTAQPGVTYWFAIMPKAGTVEPTSPIEGEIITIPTPPRIPHDIFRGRQGLAGILAITQENNIEASVEPGEPLGFGTGSLDATLWFAWRAPTNGEVKITLSASTPGLNLGVQYWRGTNLTTLTAATASEFGGIPVAAGETINFQVGSVQPAGGGTAVRGFFTLTFTFERPAATSPNDAFQNALPVTAPYYEYVASFRGATSESGETLASPGATSTLWWKFTAPGAGILDLRRPVCEYQVGFPITVDVYEGQQLNSLQPVASVHESHYPVQAGGTYAIRISTPPVSSGLLLFMSRFYSNTNDAFAGSEQLEGVPFTYFGNFTLATREPGEPLEGPGNTVWMSWAAPGTGRVYYSMARAFQSQAVEVFTGASLPSLKRVPLAHVINDIWSILAFEGTVYHFRFQGSADDFVFHLDLAPFVPATNDNFASAQEIKGNGLLGVPMSVMDATMEPLEPLHWGTGPQKSLWWKWTAPLAGNLYVYHASLAGEVLLALYQGASVDSLRLVVKATNSLNGFVVSAGQTYYLAGAVPADALGDIALYMQLQTPPAQPNNILPGNIFKEPSWEGTGIFGTLFWGMSGSIGGIVNGFGAPDGVTWLELGGGARIWQDVPTVPGHQYAVRFACAGGVHMQIWADGQLAGTLMIPHEDGGYWHWPEFTFVATNTTTRVLFDALNGAQMDAFSLVDRTAPPSIVTPPLSVSAFAGGTALFTVGANGSDPLRYQWSRNGQALPGQTNRTLTLANVTAADVGTYTVEVMNAFGTAGSGPVTLTVNPATDVTVLVQPYGDTIPVGGFYQFRVVAIGQPPLTYQWFFNGSPVDSATNRIFELQPVTRENTGSYEVRVRNLAGTTWSLPATLDVVTNVTGGGVINFDNRRIQGPTGEYSVPIFDLDEVTPLNGGSFKAQLYAGTNAESLRPVGPPSSFRSGFAAGYFTSQLLGLPNIPVGGQALIQVRAWDALVGATYEEARVLGGKFGRSGTFEVTTGGQGVGASLVGLTTFSLRAGMPSFTVGQIAFIDRLPGGRIRWALEGEPGFRYVIEKSRPDEQRAWRPFLLLTNDTGTVFFEDHANTGASSSFYRARILD